MSIDSPLEMEALGVYFGSSAACGTVLLLRGPVGAGKSVFARGFIRGGTCDPTVDVTSPTFLLSKCYKSAAEGLLFHHMDLYRIKEPRDAVPLGLRELFMNDASIIEWPECLLKDAAHALPSDYLLIDFAVMHTPAVRQSQDASGFQPIVITEEEEKRSLTFTALGDLSQRRLYQTLLRWDDDLANADYNHSKG